MELECLVDCESTAHWRARKQEQYPEDSRNSEAQELLSSLGKEMAALNGSSIHKRLERLWATKKGFGEIVSERLRWVGSGSKPKSALELLEEIAEAAEQAHDLQEGEYF
ncbi:hypothetical protein [Methylosinus sp. KRF6]|uniref:hypothetical protein n=1 Tax=Methylosinus sp. KRF6 TaxID=2846853 RepID=UPI001C0B2DCC|nr:hypothetical protein [Methylosinus sp. KRF6]MBU3887638.1 hypothetical protein [Methylosinus sp. KRF6]